MQTAQKVNIMATLRKRSGQTILEFVLVALLLAGIGLFLTYRMIAQPDGAAFKVQENTTGKIASD